ncbi:Short-chain dehydrogenase/reductase SDR [Sulfitobacter noctilucicola]|uniref:3-oxoacyl-[acyl-carrier protein] reductase n=1 Tax=Sulfitobacter noctilucicola TaxID=1342301 RepID=A0A7W6MCA7_9RHOB|nr:SDR family oxidoreductase [Sulfitobacter noctilucicola]KIN64092.1 Short-chain dehydrogenase/reductase SDR [Sulfitobacter noctilucicola]MBB4175446.1 3-oxoacyl-[acyl-carrier protein] reductase [Sulfitobacter noctilucicola]
MTQPLVQDRVVLITGGSRGLGREMAIALAQAGAKVAITGAAASDALDDTLAQLGPEAIALPADVTDEHAAEDAVAKTVAKFGRIDVLINNAGIGMRLVSETFNTSPTKFWEADSSAWARIVDANVNGPFLMARAAVPHMMAQGFGKIINISTSDQTMVRQGYAPYGPSKAFLEAASRVWAADLAGTGVDVNVLLPGGAADTDLLPPGPDKKGADGNLLSPSIMCAPALWLVSDAADGITGARFIARLWNTDDPGAARDDKGGKPQIM